MFSPSQQTPRGIWSSLTAVNGFWWAFSLLFLYRYLRLVVNMIAFHMYRPIPIPEKPRYTPEDVSVVLPTLATNPAELLKTLQSVHVLNPHEIFVVTTDNNMEGVLGLVSTLSNTDRITVLSVHRPNKRRQILRAIPKVQTKITLLLDDDVQLPEKYMEWSLAPFAEDKVGGVGTNQALRREHPMNGWNFLGAIYLARRNFDCTACNWLDGGLPCLSGRAVMYRSKILWDEDFQHQFSNEQWNCLGRSYSLPVDDDNFITRWLFSHNYDIQMQNHKECEVITTLEPDSNYLNQCIRWQRSNWRSNMTSLFTEANVHRLFPWSTYAVFITTLTQWALAIDASLCYFLYRATREWSSRDIRTAILIFFTWWTASKIVKFLGYFAKHTRDFFHFWWLLFFFGYYHNFIKLWSFFTIRRTTWGSKQEADTTDDSGLLRLRTADSSKV